MVKHTYQLPASVETSTGIDIGIGGTPTYVQGEDVTLQFTVYETSEHSTSVDVSAATGIEWVLTDGSGGEALTKTQSGGGVTFVTYSEGDLVRVTLDGIYGDEASNTTLTPGTISRPGQEADFHEVDLSLDATTQTKLQSATLNLDGLARFERGTSRQPIAAVAGPATASLDVEAIFTEADQLELAYGSSGTTSVQDSIDAVNAQFTIAPGGMAAADYALAGLKPDSYEWADLVAADTSLTEPVTFDIDSVVQQA